MAPSVEHPTVGFGSGCGPRVMRSSPTLSPTLSPTSGSVLSGESAGDSPSGLPPAFMLSKINQ